MSESHVNENDQNIIEEPEFYCLEYPMEVEDE